MELSDRELLDRFVTNRDEAAFRMLVERHLAMVHGVARRVTANEDLARDVAQNVFLRLARRAALIPRDLTLAAWLHRVAHHFAIDLVRSEDRRRKRELATHAAAAMDPTPPPDWSALAPVVDSLVNRLPAADRDILLLRFYRNEPHAAVARRLGLSEAAAKKRATRALEKLRGLLAKQGIATSAAALATLLPAHAAPPVSGLLVLSVNAAAQGILPAAPQALNLHLAMTTAQKTAVAAAALVFLGSLGYAIHSSPPLSPPGAAASLSTASVGAGDAKAGSRRERGSGLTAEQRLEKLRQIMAVPGKLKRSRQLIAFIETLAPQEFQETADQLVQLEAPQEAAEFTLLLEAWTKRDPLGAVSWSANNSKDGPHPAVLRTWGEVDSQAAIDWVLQNVPDPFATSLSRHRPFIQVLSGLVAKDPAAVVRALDRVPDEKERIRSLVGLASLTDGTGSTEDLLAEVPPGPMRSALVSYSSVSLMLDGRAGRGLELLLADEGARSIRSVGEFFNTWYHNREDEALASIDKVPEGPFRNEAAAMICLRVGNQKPELSMDLLERYPGIRTDKLVAQLADEIPVPHDFDQMVLKMEDPKLRDEALQLRLKRWSRSQPDEVRKWMDKHEVSAGVREAVLANPSATPGS